MDKHLFNTIELLHLISDKETIQTLKDKYKGKYAHIFDKGRLGGSRSMGIKDKNELWARADGIRATLQEVLKKIRTDFLPKIRRKNRSLQRMELLSQFFIIISSSSLVGLAFSSVSKYASILPAIVSLIGGLLTLFLKMNLGEWSFNNRNVRNDQDEMIDLQVEAESILNQLNAKLAGNVSFEDKSYLQLIESSESVSSNIKKILYHYSPWNGR